MASSRRDDATEQATEVWTVPGAIMTLDGGEQRLRGGRCKGCGATFFPRHAICLHCWSEDIADDPQPTKGRLYAYSVVHVARKGWRTPYIIGYVDLDNGVRVSAPIATDPANPPPFDSPVRLKVADIGRLEDGRPIMSHQFELDP
jgi:uncharacterized OB-fold protein